MIKFFNDDCMNKMKDYPDNYFDLAIVDPPYFNGPEKRQYYGAKVSSRGVKRTDYTVIKEWKVPDLNYYKELLRVSKNQIIFGINYFDFPVGSGRIIWDKVNSTTSFSDCEIASISSIDSVRLFRYMWNGMMQGKSITEGHIPRGNKKLNEKRIHQTQKPIDLYKWIYKNYAKPDYKILDTHNGSGSNAIAAIDFGIKEFVGIELDKAMYLGSLTIINTHQSQQKLFGDVG